MSRNTARRRERIERLLFVTHKRSGQLNKPAFLVPIMTVVFLGSTAWSGRVGDPDPGELVSMLDHAAIVEILTAYVREHAPWPPQDDATSDNERSEDSAGPAQSTKVGRGPTATPKPATDVQAVLTVLGRREVAYEGDSVVLDIRDTALSGANLGGAHLEHANLSSARLDGAYLQGTHLEDAGLGSAYLENAVLYQAHLEGADLSEAHLESATFVEVFDSSTTAWPTGFIPGDHGVVRPG